MLCQWLGEKYGDPAFRAVGELINGAVERTLTAGTRTLDLGGTAGTAAFGAAIIDEVVSSQ
jgi:3-isopropylmalate dehydrogenase